eukprot:g62338.t1
MKHVYSFPIITMHPQQKPETAISNSSFNHQLKISTGGLTAAHHKSIQTCEAQSPFEQSRLPTAAQPFRAEIAAWGGDTRTYRMSDKYVKYFSRCPGVERMIGADEVSPLHNWLQAQAKGGDVIYVCQQCFAIADLPASDSWENYQPPRNG